METNTKNNNVTLSKTGKSREETLKTLQSLHDQDSNWHDGRTFSLVYHKDDEHTEFLKKAYSIYFHQNALNPGAFPSLKKFESEVISIAANLFNGGEEAAGTMTSGGSESIMMAIKTYRDYYRVTRPEITAPEMIVAQSIHPAFDKAAHYFGVKMHKAPVDQDYKIDMNAVEKLMNKNTILLVGSAPQYPQGVMDPIEALAQLALKNKISMHVDACLGGFFLPFARKIGIEIPAFDFSVKGVTSISADLHKYGFTAKGASVIMYHNKDLRRHQFFVSKDWPGGFFGSPSMTGTRPAGSIAAAWATFQVIGEEGYLKIAREVMDTVQKFQKGVVELGFSIVGKPIMGVFAFEHDTLNIHAIADQMTLKGWHIDRQNNPECIHLMITPAHTSIVGKYLSDLKECRDYVAAHPETSQQGMAAMYGMVGQLPDPSMIDQFIYQTMDDRYQT